MKFQRPAARGDRLGQLALPLQGEAQVAARGGEVGIPLQGAAVRGHGGLQIPLAGQRDAEVVVRRGIRRIQRDGPAVMGHGLLRLVLPLKDRTQGIVRFDVVGIEFDRVPEALGRLCGFPAFPEGPTQIVAGLGPIGPQRDGAMETLGSGVGPANLGVDHAEQVPGVGLVGVGREDLPIELLRRRQVAGLMVANGVRQCLGNRRHHVVSHQLREIAGSDKIVGWDKRQRSPTVNLANSLVGLRCRLSHPTRSRTTHATRHGGFS